MTLIYLAILMAISLFFSLALYQISTQEIQGSLSRQQRAFERVGPFMHDFLQDPSVLAQRNQDLTSANQHLIWQLFYTNLAILIIGGGLSYLLALMTLDPIEKAHESQVRFTGDASHELRSPLASMKTEIEVALRDPKLSREEAIEILKSNLEEVDKLGKLSGYLLELANENGDNLKLVTVSASDLVKAAVESVAKLAESKKIKIESRSDAKLTAVGNKESLVELLTILLENGIKYSEPGTKIQVTAEKVNRAVLIKVIDQGVGIKASELPHIFERFYRADGSRSKNKVQGYGLGLSLAQKIAEANKAEISVESKMGEGSTFTVRLNH